MNRPITRWTRAGLAALLTACGGGGGSDSPPATGPLTLAGTAARGAALAGATVSIKCAGGAATPASATTSATGGYSVSIDNASLPCVLRVAGSGGETFHSVVPGTGSSGSFTANLSPLTELVVAQLAAAAPGAFFDDFGSSTAVSATALTQAVAYVKSAIAGVTDLGTTNPVSDALAVGNAHDQAIEAAVAGLAAAGITLQAAAAAIAANPAAPTVVSAALAPAGSECPWLKSGRYRVIDPYDPTEPPARVSIDAAAKTAVDPDGQTVALNFDGDCQYTIDEPDFTTRLVVSSSGVIMVHGQSKSTAERNFEIALPEQALPISEFAGTWNAASWQPTASPPTPNYVAEIGRVTLGANGQMTALDLCSGLAPCTPESPPLSTLAVNTADGGFDEVLPDGTHWSRVFLYKTLAGRTMFVWATLEGQLVLGTREATLELPAAGAVTGYRELSLAGNGTIGNLGEDSVTVNAVDGATRRVTRTRASDGRVDTLAYDTPFAGLRHRVANSCTIGGAPSNCAETVHVPLQGMGINVVTSVGANPATSFFNLVVNKPGP
jgi:hypothetical protein